MAEEKNPKNTEKAPETRGSDVPAVQQEALATAQQALDVLREQIEQTRALQQRGPNLPQAQAALGATGGAVDTLTSIDFNALIGGPLIAGVNASAQAAMATAEYIKAIGFASGSGTNGNYDLQTVTFTYQTLQVNQTDGTSTPVTASITVPLISILPIPYLRVDSMEIEFKANIDSMNKVTNTNTFATTNSVSGGTGGFLSIFESVKFNVSVADSNVNTAVSEQTSKYAFNVRVHAGVDPLPGGMQKVLNIFEGIIQQQIVS